MHNIIIYVIILILFNKIEYSTFISNYNIGDFLFFDNIYIKSDAIYIDYKLFDIEYIHQICISNINDIFNIYKLYFNKYYHYLNQELQLLSFPSLLVFYIKDIYFNWSFFEGSNGSKIEIYINAFQLLIWTMLFKFLYLVLKKNNIKI